MGLKGKNVLVTGAGGFIGGALTNRLVEEGMNVVCLVRSFNGAKRFALSRTTMYEGDVSDYNLMRSIISSHEIDYVFHLAASAIVRISARDPVSTYQTNVMGTVALLEACRVSGRCKKIIVASSDKAYGDHDVLPYIESMALQPHNTYDTSKACTDMIARSYAQNYDMPICVTRCSNVYGPGDQNISRIIPNSIARIMRGEPPMLFSDVSEMEREFIYIDDVVDANIALALSGARTNGEAFNVGGTPDGAIKIDTIVRVIANMMGSELEPEIVQREPMFKEIKRQFIDSSKLRFETGWAPSISLHRGLESTILHYRELFKP